MKREREREIRTLFKKFLEGVEVQDDHGRTAPRVQVHLECSGYS